MAPGGNHRASTSLLMLREREGERERGAGGRAGKQASGLAGKRVGRQAGATLEMETLVAAHVVVGHHLYGKVPECVKRESML